MLDVEKSPELQAVLLTLKQADRAIKAELNKAARSDLKPVWLGAVQARAHSSLERAVLLPGARVAVSASQVTLRAAGSGRRLRGGLVPTVDWPGVEYGMRVRRTTYQGRSPRGKGYQLTRRLGTQFPNRGKGRVVSPAAQETGTKLVGMWVRSIVDSLTANADIEATPER